MKVNLWKNVGHTTADQWSQQPACGVQPVSPENDHGVQLLYNLFMYKTYLCTKYKWLLFLLETEYSWLFNLSS